METFLIKALQLIVALIILVTIHEFGHYLFARIFGIRVNKFYLFFNPWFSILRYEPSKGEIQFFTHTENIGTKENPKEITVAKYTIKAGKKYPEVNAKGNPTWAATIYGLGWLPLGGYCDIAGMVDETKGADDLAEEPQPWEFRTKSTYKRFLVMVGGVLFNFILAIAIYAGIAFHWGERQVPYQAAYEGMDFMPAVVDAGLQNGDILLSINGEPASITNSNINWDLIQPGTVVTVLRNHKDTVRVTMPSDMLERIAAIDPKTAKKTPLMKYRVPVMIADVQGGMPAKKAGMEAGDRIVKVGTDTTPSLTEFYPALEKYAGKDVPFTVLRGDSLINITLAPSEEGKIGILLTPYGEIYPVEEIKYSLLESVPRGWDLGTTQLTTYVSSLKMLFTKEGAKQVGGFGTLGSLFPNRWDWYTFWQITAFLSVILAVMNIIPIPGLDGGHVLFLLVEMVSGRKPSDKVLEVANTIGFFFLIALLLYANGMDLIRSLM